ncbi:DUF397 domain-containing protein [Nocardia sp. NPDC003693]
MTTSAFDPKWFKSSHSQSGGDCVEAAHLDGGTVAVRDSKLGMAGPVLFFAPEAWDVFTTSVRAGQFDPT